MKFAVAFAFASLSTFAVASHGIVHHHRRQSCTTANMGSNSVQPNTDGWYQVATGDATFTEYSGCGSACKLCTYFFSVVWPHAERDYLPQRAVEKSHPGSRWR